MNPSEIKKIDQLLEALENDADDGKLQDFLNSVCNAVGLDHNTDEFFDPNNDPSQKKFITVCLLRLLCRDQDAIWEWETRERHKIVGLFDDQIGSIYHSFDINHNEQSHGKLNKLRNVENEVLEKFYRITEAIVDLETAMSVRESFMRQINSIKNKLFLDPFVTPLSLIDPPIRLNTIFNRFIEYSESSREDRLESYKEIESTFGDFLREAEACPSIFTERCVLEPLKKIHRFVNEDFQNNDAIQPTNITVVSLDHKYPFHEKDRKIELKFLIKNDGKGYARDVLVECTEIDPCLNLCDPVNLGTLKPNQSSEIVLETNVNKVIGSWKNSEPLIELAWSWSNFISDERIEADEMFELKPQRTDLNWDDLSKKQPYSLEAINEAKNLVGRENFLSQLNSRLSADKVGSSIIHGQKRVGKTSIAEVVQANFAQDPHYSVIFVPINGLDTTTPEKFVANLGETIVSEMAYTYDSFSRIEEPKFDSALAPLLQHFKLLRTISQDHKFIIILDEFDEIHPDMVQINSNVGKTFFNNIRAISSTNTGHVGFVLVGGENMQIIRESTDQLNKMEVLQVDYFDKKQYWKDFQNLVKQPVKNTIEFDDEAIDALYEMTEGHPFYTKFICSTIYTEACNERSSYITKDNVTKAVEIAIEKLDLNAVSHFWIDGINKRYDSARQDQIQTHRRKFLIAFAQIKRKKTSVTRQDLQDSEILTDVAVGSIIDKYISRGFLIEDKNHYCIWKPKFFERWLVERGFSMLTTDFLDEEAIMRSNEEEKEAYVPDREIVELCNKWGLYQGSQITTTHVRAWLEQFEYNNEQKLMFNLLRNVHFYDLAKIKEAFRPLHSRVQEDVAQRGGVRSADRRERRGDILLSSFGSPAQSGPSYARIYANENGIFVDNVVSLDHISDVLQAEESNIKAIVFVDDIIASGNSAVDFLNALNEQCGELLEKQEIKIFISAICGLHLGIEKLKDAIKKVPFEAEVIVSDLLTARDQCFSSESEVFSSSDEKNEAKQIVLEHGKLLQRKQPLGYENSQLLVVFHDNCPNNTLPILWYESTRKKHWIPLFKRV